MQGLRKNQLSEDEILNRIGCRFNTKHTLEPPKPLPVIELFLVHWPVLQNSLNLLFTCSRSSLF